MKKYELMFGILGHKAGEVLYDYVNGYDYGIKEDDERFSGLPHTLVTRNPKGGCPFFSVPTSYLKEM